MVARSRRILKFIRKVKKSKSFTFRKKLHFSTFRAKNQKDALFAKSLTFRLFGQLSHFSTFRAKNQKVALFEISCTFRLFGQFSHFSTFRATIQKVALFEKSCTFRLFGQFSHFSTFGQKFKKSHFSHKVALFDIYLSPSSPKYRIWDMSPTRQYLSIRPFSRRYRIWEYWILPHVSIYLCLLCVSIYLSAPSTADIRYGILPQGRRCRIGYGM